MRNGEKERSGRNEEKEKWRKRNNQPKPNISSN